MSLTFLHLISLLFISTSISVFMASSRPTTTHPEQDIAPSPSVVLTTSGGEKFDVPLQVALQSETIRQMIVDGGFSDEIELSFSNISGETMAKVLEYCNKHAYYGGDGAGSNMTAVDEIRAFDTQFVEVHHETLFKLILAAKDLKIKSLLELLSGRIFDIMKGKTHKEVSNMFNNKEIKCKLSFGFEFSNFLAANFFMSTIDM